MKKTRKEKGELFKKYIPMTYSMANKFSAKYKLPHAEMEDEAQSALAMIVAKWEMEGAKDSTGSPSTWIYQKMFWHLLTYCTRKQPKEIRFSAIERETPIDPPHKTGWLEGLVRTLGEDARIVANTILFAPAEIVEDIKDNLRPRSHRAREKARAAVEGYLVDQGWTGERFAAAWWELAVAL